MENYLLRSTVWIFVGPSEGLAAKLLAALPGFLKRSWREKFVSKTISLETVFLAQIYFIVIPGK